MGDTPGNRETHTASQNKHAKTGDRRASKRTQENGMKSPEAGLIQLQSRREGSGRGIGRKRGKRKKGQEQFSFSHKGLIFYRNWFDYFTYFTIPIKPYQIVICLGE